MDLTVDGFLLLLSGLDPLFFFIPLIWLFFIVSRLIPLKRFGLVPRTGRGLFGVAGMPFLHEDFRHLMSNTVPLALLLLLLYKSAAGAANVVIYTQIIGGGALWLFGRSAIHIGASLMVFGLVGFHISNGVVLSNFVTVGIALLVAALYGTTFLSSINPWRKGSSWDGHLCGFMAGVLVAVLFSKTM